MSILPITVISPVMNCVAKMADHAEHLRNLAKTVKEIIVVDSYSEDGAKQYLQDALHDCEIRFLDNPPGLYSSWNFGIAHATQPYYRSSLLQENPFPVDFGHWGDCELGEFE